MINTLNDLAVALNEPAPLSVIRIGNNESHQMLSDKLYPNIKTGAGFFGDEIALFQKRY